MIDNHVVGRRIAAMRQEHNLTQQQLAAMMNVSHQAVSKWESGQALPDIQTMLELTRFFGMSIEQLVSNEEERIPGLCSESEYESSSEGDTRQVNVEDVEINKEMEKMSIQQLLQMAPYMSKETVEEIVMEIDEKLSGNQIVRIAPYLNADRLDELIAKHQPALNWEQLRKIAPFMKRESVDALARRIAHNEEGVRQGTENINKAINDIGKAFDDIGRGMGHAVKKAIRFGENVFNEVSAAINDISSEAVPKQEDGARSVRVYALRKKAFERAIVDENWDWIAAHVQETEADTELRRKIAEAALLKGKRDWVCQYFGEFADEDVVDAAIEAQNWEWLGANIERFNATQQEKICCAAAKAENWTWLQEHTSTLHLVNCGKVLAMQALKAKENKLVLKLAEEQLVPEEISDLTFEAYELGMLDTVDALLPLANDAVLERILIDMAQKKQWKEINKWISKAMPESVEKLMEIAVDQGNFDAVDMLEIYL